MVLIAILIAALVQLLLPSCRLDVSKWYRVYLQKMVHAMGHAAQNKWLSVIFLCLPVWIVVMVVLALFNWIVGPIAYGILVLFLAWLCLDIYPRGGEQETPDQGWLANKRDALFSPLFWFALLKTPLLILHTVLRLTSDHWSSLEGNDQSSNPCADVIAVLAWIPARLMVVAAAVVGDFVATMKASTAFWAQSIRSDGEQLWSCMQASLRSKSGSEDSTEVINSTGVFAQYRAVLIVWLVVIAIFTVGYWFAG